MARRVFFHVGTLKTGTTYLQRVMWENRERLKGQGLLFAGEHFRDRVWASQTVRGMGTPHQRARTAWERIVEQVREFDGDAVISHEFFGGASAEQALAARGRFPESEIHVVATARDLPGLVPAFWQEQIKFGFSDDFEKYEPLPLDSPPSKHWSWRTIDVADVLRRWSEGLPKDQVTVVTMPPPGSPRDLLWDRFCEACHTSGDGAVLDLPPVNESLGVAETEFLRRVNEGLPAELRPSPEPARWVRGYLALEILAQRRGEKLRVSPERAAALRLRSQEIVDEIREAGFRVVGDLEDIVGPVDPPTSRQPGDVSDAELLSVAVDTVNAMLADHRRLALENAELRRGARRRGKPKRGDGESRPAAAAETRRRDGGRRPARAVWRRLAGKSGP